MSNEFQLLTRKEFDGVILDCYRESQQENTENAFWATREQIGRLLGYAEPADAIKKIHKRNKKRLDKFSRGGQFVPSSGGTQQATVYNFKGLLEICRYSQQPNANRVIDVLWDIADEIRQTGMYISPAMQARIDELERKIASMEKVLSERYSLSVLGETVLGQTGAISFKDGATFLSQHGVEIGQNRLFKYCRDKKLLCSRKGRQWNKPTQAAVDKGLFNIEVNGGFNTITLITPKGLQYLTDEFMKDKYPLLVLMASKGEVETQG